MDLECWVWSPGLDFLDLESWVLESRPLDPWVGIRGFVRVLALLVWILRFEFMPFDSWVWHAGLGILDLDSWAWRPRVWSRGFRFLRLGFLELDWWPEPIARIQILTRNWQNWSLACNWDVLPGDAWLCIALNCFALPSFALLCLVRLGSALRCSASHGSALLLFALFRIA